MLKLYKFLVTNWWCVQRPGIDDPHRIWAHILKLYSDLGLCAFICLMLCYHSFVIVMNPQTKKLLSLSERDAGVWRREDGQDVVFATCSADHCHCGCPFFLPVTLSRKKGLVSLFLDMFCTQTLVLLAVHVQTNNQSVTILTGFSVCGLHTWTFSGRRSTHAEKAWVARCNKGWAKGAGWTQKKVYWNEGPNTGQWLGIDYEQERKEQTEWEMLEEQRREQKTNKEQSGNGKQVEKAQSG